MHPMLCSINLLHVYGQNCEKMHFPREFCHQGIQKLPKIFRAGHRNCPKYLRFQTIHWKALEEHFLMVPFVFRFNHFRGNAFSDFFLKKSQSLKRWAAGCVTTLIINLTCCMRMPPAMAGGMLLYSIMFSNFTQTQFNYCIQITLSHAYNVPPAITCSKLSLDLSKDEPTNI
jgi:hypothetical protein